MLFYGNSLKSFLLQLYIYNLHVLPSKIFHHCNDTFSTAVVIETESGGSSLDSFHFSWIGLGGPHVEEA